MFAAHQGLVLLGCGWWGVRSGGWGVGRFGCAVCCGGRWRGGRGGLAGVPPQSGGQQGADQHGQADGQRGFLDGVSAHSVCPAGVCVRVSCCCLRIACFADDDAGIRRNAGGVTGETAPFAYRMPFFFLLHVDLITIVFLGGVRRGGVGVAWWGQRCADRAGSGVKRWVDGLSGRCVGGVDALYNANNSYPHIACCLGPGVFALPAGGGCLSCSPLWAGSPC